MSQYQNSQIRLKAPRSKAISAFVFLMDLHQLKLKSNHLILEVLNSNSKLLDPT